MIQPRRLLRRDSPTRRLKFDGQPSELATADVPAKIGKPAPGACGFQPCASGRMTMATIWRVMHPVGVLWVVPPHPSHQLPLNVVFGMLHLRRRFQTPSRSLRIPALTNSSGVRHRRGLPTRCSDADRLLANVSKQNGHMLGGCGVTSKSHDQVNLRFTQASAVSRQIRIYDFGKQRAEFVFVQLVPRN